MRSSLGATWIDDGDDRHGWDGRVGRYELSRPRTDAELAEAIDVAEAALLPASKETLLVELGRVRVLTVSRDVGADLPAVFAAYTNELKRYPADVVRDVLDAWPREEKFWPSGSELIARMDRLVAPRHALLNGLRQGYRAPEVSPDWIPPPSEEDKAADVVLLTENGLLVDNTGRLRPMEEAPPTEKKLREVAAELRNYKLPAPDDSRVVARLREMGIEA